MMSNNDRRGALDYGSRLWLKALLGLTYFFLYSPIVVLMVFSFNNSARNIVWEGFTFNYYLKALQDRTLIGAFQNSLIIALVSTGVSTVIGALVGLQLWRFRFPGKAVYEGLVTLPIVIPEITMGVALMVFFYRTGWATADFPYPFNLGTIIVAHIAFSFPFVAVVVRARMSGFNSQLEEASRDLGASSWQTYRYIIIPYMRPGLIAGAALAFTLSLDDFIITYFSSGPGVDSFPVLVYSRVRFGLTPAVNALASILILLTLFAAILMMKLQAPKER